MRDAGTWETMGGGQHVEDTTGAGGARHDFRNAKHSASGAVRHEATSGVLECWQRRHYTVLEY